MSAESDETLPIHKATITTARLHLRPLRVSDVDDIHEFRSDPECMQWATSKASTSLAMTESWIRDIGLSKYSQRANFSIELLHDKRDKGGQKRKVIGVVGVAHCPEIGYIFNRKYHGRGYATEAIQAFLELFWKYVPTRAAIASKKLQTSQAVEVPAPAAPTEFVSTEGVEKPSKGNGHTEDKEHYLSDGWDFVEAMMDPENTGSARVLVKAGFVLWQTTKDDFESPTMGLRGTAVFRIARPGTELGPAPGPFEVDMDEKTGIKKG